MNESDNDDDDEIRQRKKKRKIISPPLAPLDLEIIDFEPLTEFDRLILKLSFDSKNKEKSSECGTCK